MRETNHTKPDSNINPLRVNIFANFAGSAFVSLLAILFTPFYLAYLGVEAYGLVGFFVSFQALVSILDLGLSVTANRELAMRAGIKEKEQESRDIVRTLEVVFWGAAIIIGLLAWLASPVIGLWLNPRSLAPETVTKCLVIMGWIIAFQFPVGFYSGVLLGLQKHLILNGINAVFGVLKTAGTVAILHFVSASPEAFFGWQLGLVILQAFVSVIVTWRVLPPAVIRATFSKSFLKDSWRFAAGISGISVMSIFLTQADKLVLSKILPLDAFGYYAFASAIANGLSRLIQPVFQSYFPRLSQQTSAGDQSALSRTYHQGCQLMSVVVFPVAVIPVFFSRELLDVWQHNPATTENAWLLLSILAAGTSLNSLLSMPYALQLANGWTRLYFYALMVAVIVLTPATVFIALNFDIFRVAAIWVVLNIAFIMIVVPIMHRSLLRGEIWKWYLNDVSLPVFAVAGVGIISRFLFIANAGRLVVAAQLAVVFIASFIAACLATPYPRKWVKSRLFG